MADAMAPPRVPLYSKTNENAMANKPKLPPTSVPALKINESGAQRSANLNLDMFSPVNQNGSFEFDRIIKSGEVNKRNKKTKWKRFYLVLRPNLLSIYKNSSEEKLHKQVNLSDLTAVALLKDPKGRRENTFGLFSPSKNVTFQADSLSDARIWVDMIRREAKIDEEEEMIYKSPIAEGEQLASLDAIYHGGDEQPRARYASSSPEPMDIPLSSSRRDGVKIPGASELEYSGNEAESYSDWSDTAPSRSFRPSSPYKKPSRLRALTEPQSPSKGMTMQRPQAARNASHASGLNVERDEERTIQHGYLLCLKSKGGVRQWKRLWVVLRPKHIAFYKNEEEYAARLVIPMLNIINAVEIDSISRTKDHCFQIIAEEKRYRLAASSEESLTRWLGAIKSQIAKRKDREQEKGNSVASS